MREFSKFYVKKQITLYVTSKVFQTIARITRKMDIEFGETEFVQDDLFCSICDAEFLDKEDLELHIAQLHVNEYTKKRFCTLCTHIYPDIYEYALHIRNRHLSELKCCKHCFRLFKSIFEVQEHEKKHKAGVLYPRICCSQCNKDFDSKKAVRFHELNEHCGSDDGILFKSCLSIMSSLLCMNIDDFMAATHNNLTYICISCNKNTLDIKEYIQHLIDNKCCSYACDNCCHVFKRKCDIAKHFETCICITDTNIMKRCCPKCGIILKKTPLRVHLRSCAVITCKECEMTFQSVSEYTNHRSTEHNTNLLSTEACIYCQRQMVGADAMKKHMERTHGKDIHLYKYHCTDCDKIFKHPKFLFAHFYSTHKDLQPYTCKICNEKFRIRKNFTLHIKLRHKSVGYVEFDDNFHVYFTDKKSIQKPNGNEPNNKQDTTKNDDEVDKSEKVHNLIKTLNEKNESNSERDDENDIRPDSVGKGKLLVEISSVDYCEKDEVFRTERNVTECTNESNDKKGMKPNDKEVSDRVSEKTEELETDCEMADVISKKPVKKQLKHKYKQAPKKNRDKDRDCDTSSDDSDVPLKMVRKNMKIKKKIQKKKMRNIVSKVPLNMLKKKKFYCNKCNRNCYTYQNYHRHLALHTKNLTKVCIKCFGKFNSVKKLNEHITNEHSSSQLTETLKKLLEKRKKAEERTKVIPKTQNSEELPLENIEKEEVSTSEKFRNTIKKVNIEKNTAKVTMTLIDKDKISVKKFLESFNPDNNEVKITMLKTLDKTAVKRLRPLIKFTKVNMDPMNGDGLKLKMPVKFTDAFDDNCRVDIKFTTDYVAPKMTFGNPIYNFDEFNDQNDSDYDDKDYGNETDTKHVIPEVAQEVMLEGTEEPNNVVRNIRTIKNLPLPAWNKVQVATLSNEAPYFKITKINLDNEKVFKLQEKEPEENVPKEVILPNGKKLVSANPYAHLLDNKKIDELLNVKKKKAYYKPKLVNVAQALKKAMEKIDTSPPVKVKKEKRNVV